MKRAYIVSYDLVAPGKNYERVIGKIKQNHAWARLGGSAYIVISDQTPADLRNAISADMDANDKLFVGAVGAPAAWIGLTDEVSEWLKKNLK